MEFQFYWLLLLPLFFGLGWLAARMDLRQLLSESRALPSAYFKGLNFLINEQPDQAIEALSEVAQSHQQTTELHFTLGSLFRRRGELDRATRTHQMLLDRSDLPNDQRVAALHELAQDYLKAGVLDRAESLFLELKGTDFETSASHFLREIYVSEKEWGKAIEVAKKQTGLNASKLLNRDISHYLCELAALDYSHGKAMQADQYIDQALEMNPRCVRASILRGESHFKEGRVKDALKEWLQIEKQNPDYLFLITPSVFSAYKELGQPDIGLKLLQDWLIQYPSLELLSQVYQATIEHQGPDAALALAKHEFYNSPTLPALSKYLEAQINVLGSVHHLATHDSGPLVHNTDRSDLELTQKLVHAQVQKQALFICHHCGFKARQFHWNCPACGHWESYSPRRDTDSEDMASSLVRM